MLNGYTSSAATHAGPRADERVGVVEIDLGRAAARDRVVAFAAGQQAVLVVVEQPVLEPARGDARRQVVG